jgi:hypothetical protein
MLLDITEPLRWPYKDIHNVLASHVYEGTYPTSVNVIEAGTGKREALGREVLNFRGELYASIEPWLHAVRVTGRYLKRLILKERTNVGG